MLWYDSYVFYGKKILVFDTINVFHDFHLTKMTVIQLYGIANCDTVKKARAWLQEQQINFEFIDFKKQAPSAELITNWLQTIPLETLLNKKGTTWRKLSEEQKAQANSEEEIVALMIAYPSLIKRPILSINQQHYYVGFQTELYSTLFATQ